MRKLLILLDFPQARDALALLLPGWDIIITDDIAVAEPHFADVEVIAGWNSDAVRSALKSPNLRWIQAWSAGVDGYPLDELKARGVFLTNASGVHSKPISETIFAMMLAFARGLNWAIPNRLNHCWHREGGLWEIHGQTVGILGAGAIGSEVARLAKAFGMRVLGVRRSGEETPYVDHTTTMAGLGEVLSASDFVVNVLPLTSETSRIMDAERFAQMKSTACYINCGRGGTTDQDALIAALTDGTIAYAGLDVVEPEPLPEDNALWAMDNVILTPHNAGNTGHYNDRALEILMENLSSYLREGRPTRNVIDFDLRY